MIANSRLLSGLGVVLLLALPVVRAQSPAAGDEPIVVKTSLDVRMPEKLRVLLLANPAVRFLITVDEDSRLIEYVAIEATHHELLERAEQAIREARFAAAKSGGQAVQSTVEVAGHVFRPGAARPARRLGLPAVRLLLVGRRRQACL
jgi:hypothetical protein